MEKQMGFKLFRKISFYFYIFAWNANGAPQTEPALKKMKLDIFEWIKKNIFPNIGYVYEEHKVELRRKIKHTWFYNIDIFCI